MPTQPPIPPLLHPYLNPPPSSLTLLTSTLGASTTWLVLRFIHAALKPRFQSAPLSFTDTSVPVEEEKSAIRPTINNEGPTTRKRVVLVSWLRNATWWKEEACRSRLGLDFSKDDQEDVVIIDALSTSLGLSNTSTGQNTPSDTLLILNAVKETILKAILLSQSSSVADQTPHATEIGGTTAASASSHQAPALLLLDGLDLLLAATAIPEHAIADMVLDLREHVDCTIVTATTDGPFMQSPRSPLEVNHAAFVMGMVHQANLVLSVRELDTGVARDVSGVVRVTNGAGSWEASQENWEEKECLYFMGEDGRVRVFERGT